MKLIKISQIFAIVGRLLTSIVNSILNFIFSPYCLVCNTLLPADERLICQSCWHSLPQLDEDYDLFDEIKYQFKHKIYFCGAVAVWEFNPTIQTAIHYLKYQNCKVLANRMALFMAERLNRLKLPPENTILIPVPLHKTRTRERGYNQSALLCQVIASETGFSYNDQILKRIRYTQSQTKLDASERLRNVHKAFKVTSPHAIIGKIIILVDDVITTGATINECARELKNAGAEEIYACSAAKA